MWCCFLIFDWFRNVSRLSQVFCSKTKIIHFFLVRGQLNCASYFAHLIEYISIFVLLSFLCHIHIGSKKILTIVFTQHYQSSNIQMKATNKHYEWSKHLKTVGKIRWIVITWISTAQSHSDIKKTRDREIHLIGFFRSTRIFSAFTLYEYLLPEEWILKIICNSWN